MNDIVSVVDIFAGENFRVLTPSREDFAKVLEFCDRNGITWREREPLLSSVHLWNSYKDDTRVTFHITASRVYITYGSHYTDGITDNLITTQQLLSLCPCKYTDISDLL